MNARLARLVSRGVLLGPGPVRRAAARRAADPAEAWILCQPRPVRESFVREVLDAGDEDPRRQEVWMLRQPRAVRESYVREVIGREAPHLV